MITAPLMIMVFHNLESSVYRDPSSPLPNVFTRSLQPQLLESQEQPHHMPMASLQLVEVLATACKPPSPSAALVLLAHATCLGHGLIPDDQGHQVVAGTGRVDRFFRIILFSQSTI